MRQQKITSLSAFLLAAVMLIASAGQAVAAKPTVGGTCKQCHQPQANVVRGTLVGISNQFKTIQVAVGSLVWVVKFGDDLAVTGAERLEAIPKDKEIGVSFKGDEKNPYAVSVSVKPPAKIPPEKLARVEDVRKLVAMGPEKGNFVLVDSRPRPRYLEGHIPFAVSLPNDKFDRMKDAVLPKDKGKPVIFYCAGVT
ncbi:MAG: rhodanese-like domain-containing protein [Nitrospiraceae bacterium]|nr:rhodanese-like domain-containing protein [Nitrospiraceae bacterium]